jgi:small subunit ribosomal protein S2
MNFELKKNKQIRTNFKPINSNYLLSKKEENNNFQFILKMIKAGVHFGHKTKKWNPKMAPFIYQKLQGIHIIDIIQSYTYLKNCCKLLYTKSSSKNYNTFLFVGTKKQSPIPNCILHNAFNCNSFYINKKWLSGMLTNWKNTIQSIKILKYLKLYQKTNHFNTLSVKLHSIIERKKERLERYFGGIQNMITIPNTVIIVGQQTELTALKECKKLGIRNITVLDTDCNPEFADLFIPANDDSSSSLSLILGELQIAINLGRQNFYKNSKNKNILKESISIFKII